MSTTMTLAELQAYVTVVRQGSFTRAAETLGSSKAQISRQVSRLEQRLGVQLLQRSTRRLSMTEAGEELNERANDILFALEDAVAALTNTGNEPAGRLRVVAGTEYGALVVNRWISAYLDRYPDVRVNAAYTNRLDDIVHDGIDVAIRVGVARDSELVARKLGELTYQLCATPDYLKRHGVPRSVAELDEHRRVMFSPRGRVNWRLTDGRQSATIQSEPQAATNSQLLALRLVLDGHGIGLVPTHQLHQDLASGRLVSVLPGWTREPVPVNAIFPSSRYLTAKVRRFIDLCVEQFDVTHGAAGS